jgi:hypothetical protein
MTDNEILAEAARRVAEAARHAVSHTTPAEPMTLNWKWHGKSGELRWSAKSATHHYFVHAVSGGGGCLRVVRLSDYALELTHQAGSVEACVERAAELHAKEVAR